MAITEIVGRGELSDGMTQLILEAVRESNRR
jgi:hypothetical protein